ncbi:cytochrome c1 [Shewanella sp.]|uniref:cytochrome c1 n=1 Tax=Shewanella sp. TaxID=50422 RepID=UPI003A969D7C
MRRFLTLLCCCLPLWSVAADVELQHANIDSDDLAAQQRGFKAFQMHCASCHSTHFQRYQRVADDLKLSADELQQYMFTDAKVNGLIESAMSEEEASRWFGMAPPDLTLVSRVRGDDWIYTFLNSFYRDDKRPFGVNNRLLPYTAMPHVLQSEQGLATANFVEKDGKMVIESLSAPQNGSMTADEYAAMTKDITAYLSYAADPVKAKREAIGWWVMGYLGLFFLLAWLLKKEYWKDVH